MEIVHIFGKKLYAFKYPGETKDEFARLFDLWNDPVYLEDFFETHISDLQSGFWPNASIEDAISDTKDYAEHFEDILFNLSEVNTDIQEQGLESIFQHLDDNQSSTSFLNKNKAKENWLRIYALRIEKDVYIITGGAIKLTFRMQDSENTRIELSKIDQCRKYLLKTGIVDSDGLIEEVES